MAAAYNGHLEVATLLLSHGASLVARDRKVRFSKSLSLLVCRNILSNMRFQGCTPLMCAAEQGHAALVKMLVQAGSEANTRDCRVS